MQPEHDMPLEHFTGKWTTKAEILAAREAKELALQEAEEAEERARLEGRAPDAPSWEAPEVEKPKEATRRFRFVGATSLAVELAFEFTA